MADSKIEWTEQTWNPIVGCSIVSPGCTNCYAMKMAARIIAMAGNTKTALHYDKTVKDVKDLPVWTGVVNIAPDHILRAPLRRKKSTTYFVNSMSDLFHESVPDEWIDKVFAVMMLCQEHTFQVLTKRAERMREYLQTMERCFHGSVDTFASRWGAAAADVSGSPCAAGAVEDVDFPIPNVWLGVSTERQQEANLRIPLLLQTPAAVRFISAEPLLGPIDLRPWLSDESGCEQCDDDLGGMHLPRCHLDNIPREEQCPEKFAVFEQDEGPVDEDGAPAWIRARRINLDWVIAGGESGPDARPMHPDWARSLRDQCASADVPYFFKQWGEYAPATMEQAATNPRSGWIANKAYPHVARASELYPEAGAALISRVGKKAAGRLLDGVEHNAMPSRGVA